MRLLDRPSSFAIAAVLGAGFSLTACAVGNVTTDTTGSGGAGAAGGTTASAGGSGGSVGTGGTTGSGGSGGAGGSGGSEGPCFGADDCVAFSDACNVGACINGACGKLYTNNGGACEDGKECSQNDTCQYGVCMPGSSKPCTVDNPCAVGVCDVETDTCVETAGNNGAFCNLGDSCILSASCLNGVCQPTQIVNCTNLDGPCSTGYCDPQGGCKAIPKNDGAACNDSLFCTVQDQCVAGSCQGVPNTCAAPGDACMIGSCNEAAKTCVAVPGNNGASCDDGNPCTAGETCSSGSCLGGAAANDGAACDDKNGCTGGTSCVNGTCANAQSQIVACVDGDMCCPAGCANDKDCLYWVSGVQVDVPAASLTGWTQCFADHYDNLSTPMAQILSQCNQAKLLLACRPVGATSFTTLAMGMRPDVLFDCGSQQGCTQQGNGVGWYYSDSYSWGYAPAGEPVSRNSCDTQSTEQPNRLCWHSGGGAINGGWRCGSATGLNDDPSWERVVYQAN